jgi:transglutaminase-like putative cysteine protease
MRYQVSHKTTYDYTEPVSLCHNLVHLRPRESPRQVCQRQRLTITPEPRVLQNRVDYFGNPIVLFTIQEPHRRLSVSAEHRIDVMPTDPMRLEESMPWEQVRDRLKGDRAPVMLDAYQYVFSSPFIPRNQSLADYGQPSFPPGQPILVGALDLMHRVHREFRYDPKATTLATPLHEVLAERRGVCQDFAHLVVGCVRSLGLAARYVSGYLLTTAPTGQARLVGADASHAWVSVFCPRLGWIDFDPTNDMIPSHQHITAAWGRDYDDVSPVKGVILGGGTHRMSVAVHVEPVPEPVKAAPLQLPV